MRKNKVCLVLLFCTTLLTAQKKDSTQYYFNFWVSNDSWGGGFTHINDDYRSFGTGFSFGSPGKFDLTCNFSGLTDKGRTEIKNAERLDELFLTAHFLIKKKLLRYTNLYGIVGVYDINKLGGEALQNATHSEFGVAQVKLPYSNYRRTGYQAGIGINSNNITLVSATSSSLCLQPAFEAFSVPGYFRSLAAWVPFKLSSLRGDVISIAPGYQFSQPTSVNPLLGTIVNIESGPTLEYKLQAGIFFMNWKVFPKSNYSIGAYGIRFLINGNKVSYREADLLVEAGNLENGNGYYSKYLWNKTPVWNEHLHFVLYHQYGTYLRKRLSEYPKLYGHYFQSSLGAEVNAIGSSSKFPVIPYAGLHLGLKREAVYSGTDKIAQQLALAPIAFGEAGLKIKSPLRLFNATTQWGISLHYKYLYSFSRSNNALFWGTYHLPTNIGYFGGGLFVNLDL